MKKSFLILPLLYSFSSFAGISTSSQAHEYIKGALTKLLSHQDMHIIPDSIDVKPALSDSVIRAFKSLDNCDRFVANFKVQSKYMENFTGKTHFSVCRGETGHRMRNNTSLTVNVPGEILKEVTYQISNGMTVRTQTIEDLNLKTEHE
ncbi:MAG: hypothetical protein AB7I27_05430 [Bacteriovoracaceae bacterium]